MAKGGKSLLGRVLAAQSKQSITEYTADGAYYCPVGSKWPFLQFIQNTMFFLFSYFVENVDLRRGSLGINVYVYLNKVEL